LKKKLKPWQKTAVSYLSFFLIIAIIAVSFVLLAVSPDAKYGIKSGAISHSKAGEDITEKIINSTSPTDVLENDKIKLSLTQNGNISVTNKATGKVWSSAVDDALMSRYSQGYGETHSLCSITYVNDKNAESVWTSYEQCVQKNQMCIYKLSDNTIRFDLILGESTVDQLIPTGITKERFEEYILPKLNEDDAAFLKRQYLLYTAEKLTASDNPNELYEKYPELKNTPIYIAGNIEAKITKKKLTSVFEKIGYTAEDYDKDNSLTGFGASSVTFTYKLCIDLSINDNELKVSVPKDEIVFFTEHPLLKISLMRFLTSATDKSSVLIPSGSGAIAQFKPKGNPVSFTGKVYGEDLTVNQKTLPSVMDNDAAISLPMFALRSGIDTVTAVIEGGAANAQLQYSTTEGAMSCYYDFTVLQSDKAYIDEKNNVIQCGNDVGSEDIRLSYRFDSASNEETDDTVFSKIACEYKDSLKSDGMLASSSKENPTLLLNLLGSINIKKDLLGLFPVSDSLVLTSFGQAEEIVNWFSDNSTSDLAVSLSGFSKGGLYRQAPGEISFSSDLGGKSGYKDLTELLNKKSISYYLSAEHISFLNPSAFDGFNEGNTALFVDGSTAQLAAYSPVEGSNFSEEGKLNIISPNSYFTIAQSYSDSDIKALSVGKLGNSLNSDYSYPYFDRTRTQTAVVKSLGEYKKKGIEISVEDANLYALKYCSRIENIPVKAGKSSVFAKTFPLKQIIMHGTVDYTTEVDFGVKESSLSVLEAIRSGSGIKCNLAYNNADYSFNSYYSFIYSADYKKIRQNVADCSNMVNEALKGLGNVAITEYESKGDVSKTVFENGTVIYVNTSDTAVVFDTQKIDAMSYLRIDK